MPTTSLPIRQGAIIRLRDCADDLQVVGGDYATLDIVCSDDDAALDEIVQDEQGVLIENFSESLTLRVPRHVTIDVQAQSGAVTISNVQQVRLGAIEDDVRLRMIVDTIQLDSLHADLVIERAGRVQGAGTIDGDARITGVGQLELAQISGDATISDTPVVQIGHVDSDALVTGARERVTITVVEGDLRLRDAGTVGIEQIHGDFTAARVQDVQAMLIDGDCTVQSEGGTVALGTINGDLTARLPGGRLRVGSVGGDATIDGANNGLALGEIHGDLTLRLDPLGAARYQAHTHSDASVTLPERCDVTIEAQARGGIHGAGAARSRKRIDTLSTVLGSGAARLDLVVGGELTLRGANRASVQPDGSLPNMRADALTSATGPTVRLQPFEARNAAQQRDEERLAILRMVADGRIGAGEAEQLLQAIEEPGGTLTSTVPGERGASRGPSDVFANLSAAQLIELKNHGVDRQFIAQLRQIGITNLSVGELIDFRTHNVTSEFIAAMQALGLPQLSPARWIDLRVHGVDPTFITSMVAVGFGNLSASELIDLRVHGVTPAFVQQMRARGITELDVPQLIDLKIHGVDQDFVQPPDADKAERDPLDDDA